MGKNSDRLNAYMKKEKTQSSPSYNSTRLKQSMFADNVDSLNNDYQRVNNLIQSSYSGWQDKDTLASNKASVEAMRKRLGNYTDAFSSTWDDTQKTNMNSVLSTYDKFLNDYDSLSSLYGYYKTRDAFDNAVRKSNEVKTTAFEDKYGGIKDKEDFIEKSQSNEAIEALDNNGRRTKAGAYALDNMNEEERKIANYIYNTEGEDEYIKYIRNASTNKQSERYDDLEKRYTDWVKAHPVLGGATATGANIASTMLASPAAALQTATDSIDGLIANPKTGASAIVNLANAGQQQAVQNFKDMMPNANIAGISVPGVVANAATEGVLNRALQRAFGGYTNVVMGMSSAVTSYKQSLDSGDDNATALKKAAINGIVEWLTEQIGMEWAFGDAKTMSSTILKQAEAEGAEEVVGNVLNAILDGMVNKDQSDIAKQYNEYLDRGFTKGEAFLNTLGDNTRDTVEAAVTAALSAGVEGGVHEVRVANTGKNIDREAFANAMENANPDVYKEYADLVRNGIGKASNWQIGNAYTNTVNEAVESYNEASKDYKKADKISTLNSDEFDIKSEKMMEAEGKMRASKDLLRSLGDVGKKTTFDAKEVNTLYDYGYTEGVDEKVYDKNFKLLMTSVMANESFEEVVKSIDTNVISESKAEIIYNSLMSQK